MPKLSEDACPHCAFFRLAKVGLENGQLVPIQVLALASSVVRDAFSAALERDERLAFANLLLEIIEPQIDTADREKKLGIGRVQGHA